MKSKVILLIAVSLVLVFMISMISAATCRDDRGRSYYCYKEYYTWTDSHYSNQGYYLYGRYVANPDYSRIDKYGNVVRITKNYQYYNYDNDYYGKDYYDYRYYEPVDYGKYYANDNYNCQYYYSNTQYGEYLRNHDYKCTYTYVANPPAVTGEKPPVVYIG